MPSGDAETLAEVREIGRSLSGLLSMPDGPEKESGVWSLYARCEKLVSVIKFKLDIERPGRFLKLPRSEDPEEFLPVAMGYLTKAEDLLGQGRLLESLESLREARTNLRAYLASRRRIRMRSSRKRLPSARPS